MIPVKVPMEFAIPVSEPARIRMLKIKSTFKVMNNTQGSKKKNSWTIMEAEGNGGILLK